MVSGRSVRQGEQLPRSTGRCSPVVGQPNAGGRLNFFIVQPDFLPSPSAAIEYDDFRISAPPGGPGWVQDLKAFQWTGNTVTLSFSQKADGAGAPAEYDVRYALSPISWDAASPVSQGSCQTPLAGTAIDGPLT